MPIDIDLFRTDKGKFVFTNSTQLVGGDPEIVRASQKARFASEELVDEVIRLDALFKKSKFWISGFFGVFCGKMF